MRSRLHTAEISLKSIRSGGAQWKPVIWSKSGVFYWLGAVVDCGCLKCGLSNLGAVPFARLLRLPARLTWLQQEPRETRHRMAIRSD